MNKEASVHRHAKTLRIFYPRAAQRSFLCYSVFNPISFEIDRKYSCLLSLLLDLYWSTLWLRYTSWTYMSSSFTYDTLALTIFLSDFDFEINTVSQEFTQCFLIFSEGPHSSEKSFSLLPHKGFSRGTFSHKGVMKDEMLL